MSGAGPIPARERQRIYRARQAAGEVVVSVRVSKRDTAALVRARLLVPGRERERADVAAAVEAMLDRLPR